MAFAFQHGEGCGRRVLQLVALLIWCLFVVLIIHLDPGIASKLFVFGMHSADIITDLLNTMVVLFTTQIVLPRI
ncbi:MAG: hypothetical protein J3R72DRAFT_442622 [Linnemannia gamsii]|nr:MAG: hypothetical protein J3R72DRAFT_442622 [Linnemannia gamsii]